MDTFIFADPEVPIVTGAKSNIVLLTMDCFRYDYFGFNGYHRNITPFLDSLFTDVAVFDNAYATR